MDQYLPFDQRGPSPVRRILITLGLVMLGMLLAGAVTFGVISLMGFDFQDLANNFSESSPINERNAMRLAALLSQVFNFLIPAIVASYIFYKSDWSSYQRIDAPPLAKYLGLGALMIVAAFPLAQFTYWLNSLMPLPEVLMDMEDSTAELIKGILVMNSPLELLFNLLVISLIPAIAEEMIFRGIIQDSFEKIISNPHIAIAVSAIVFSAIHMQFEGFLPRVILGLVLGYLFYWTRNLWVPIAAHAVNNGLQVIGAYFYPEEIASMEIEALDSSVILPGLISLVITAAVGWYILKLKDGERMVY